MPLIAVVVVHDFSRQQRSAEELFGHDAMQMPSVKLHVSLACAPTAELLGADEPRAAREFRILFRPATPSPLAQP
jgi:hypothetical protein